MCKKKHLRRLRNTNTLATHEKFSITSTIQGYFPSNYKRSKYKYNQANRDNIVDTNERENPHNRYTVLKQADISPQTNTKGNKGKAQVENKPTRVLSKRNAKIRGK